MRIVKFIVIAVLGVAVLTVVIGLLLPRNWNVETSTEIAGTPDVVRPLVADFRNWQKWAGWNNDADPDAKFTYSDVQNAPGATMSWEGPKMGRGTIKITRVDDTGVWLEEQIEADKVNAHGSVTWTPKDGMLHVVWTDQGELPPVMGGYFRSLIESSLKDHFQTGLSKLKVEAEKAPSPMELPVRAAPSGEADAGSEDGGTP